MSVKITLNKTPMDYAVNRPPIWCPGCGDYGILEALKRALAGLGIPNEEVVVVSGIGCSSQLPHFLKTYGIHGIHGRAIPIATGVKIANPRLKVIVVGGDGDGYGIGLNHMIHAARRNVGITYIVSNNQVYGLTTGQMSPTTLRGVKTKTTPYGSIDEPVNPLALALAAGATFVARGFSGDVAHLTQIIAQALSHRGFALVDVLSPCVTFNKVNTYEWFRARVYKLEEAGHDPSDYWQAYKKAVEWPSLDPNGRIPIGVFYKNEEKPTYEEEIIKILGVPPIEAGVAVNGKAVYGILQY
ncbi:2-oxoacid:acceptor oxidoreductase, beta subunit, pyruvate/2-ketoisovalerate family [Pyrobaculum oguniense TE7]|uniref:2-oxoacid oxidoreductase (ferredoxin) n=1 Tax=Pyrobaculum oguniense (strain DSM 13380 / JCM 10595 / TE7) TaxID=698757 RepID=H6Q9U2_PYROT|nr:2-oxoacid:acceptor oxidoreductase, beta subunit, pyruvate/2-ketoisovalerate family [Pyrobaculum oguniense TE7]